ncbi:MAG: HAD-IA family hydrolase [Aestuariivirga sp.]
MSHPRLVIFDMDDVLCHYQVGRRLRELARLAGTTARDVRTALWDSGFEGLADAGGFADSQLYLKEFGERLGYPITVDEWVAARRMAMIANTEVLQLAEAIGQQAELAIYTNNGPLVKSHLDTLFPEAAAVFKQRYCSFEFGTKKPDPESFTRLVNVMGYEPAACWFIDDKKSNVQGALIAGLQAHLFVDFEGLKNEARNIGFKL